MAISHVTRLTCVACGAHYGLDTPYTCPKCGMAGILDVEYDYEKAARTLTRDALASRPANQWRYRELLPIADHAEPPALHVGWTPIYPADRLARELGIKGLMLKDDGRNPTGSFKDRASAVGVVKAREAGAKTIACASTGNAASSLAGFSASVGLDCVIFVPERAPEPKVAQLLVFGARVFKVRGSYDQAYDLCMQACERFGWYNRNCAINAHLIEGKKTVGLEIAEQLGDRVPDWVVFSVGDGCTIAGAWKGLAEMKRLGFLRRTPRMLGVQAAGSAPIVECWKTRKELRPVEAQTIADSIAVGAPRNWRKVLHAMKESNGELLSVPDQAILDMIPVVARKAAVFAEPAGVTAVAGLKAARERGIVAPGESALCVITGNGLKDVASAMRTVTAPESIPPDIGALAAKVG